MIGNRAVAFIDILGFRDLIQKNDTSTIAEKYTQVIAATEALNQDLLPGYDGPRVFKNNAGDKGWCIRKIFSDSIILFSHEDSEEATLRLLIYVWRILQACLSMRMPFRGGIAYDEIFIDEIKEIYLGRALTKAYELEGSQEWIGVSIHDELAKAFPGIFADRRREYLQWIFLKYPVPFKGGGRRFLHTMNWRFNLIVKDGTRSLMPYSTKPSVIEKVKNTLKYAETVVQSGNVYFSNPSLSPLEVRSFYCGGKEPPFSHGDDL